MLPSDVALSDSGSCRTYDLIIEATADSSIDGTGAPWFAADVGIRGGTLAAIGDSTRPTAKRRSTPQGRVVGARFIDMLRQSRTTRFS